MSGAHSSLRLRVMATVMPLALFPVLGLATPASTTQASSTQVERKHIAEERKAIEARYKAGEAVCRQQFVVTACVNEQQTQRREALELLRQRELVLDEAKRKTEAEENARRLQAKREEAAAKAPPVPRAASAANPPLSAKLPASAPSERVRQRSKTADDPAAAAERVAAQQRRASEAAAHRASVDQRNAERAARGKKSAPLGVPAPLPPASAASR
jgi:hypothetical protein